LLARIEPGTSRLKCSSSCIRHRRCEAGDKHWRELSGPRCRDQCRL
jgi:hypothetical protein